MDPLTLGFAAVGAISSIFGGSEEAEGAEAQRAAELKADRLMTKNTKNMNALYRKKAENTYKTEKEKQQLYKAFAQDFTQGAKAVTEQINGLIEKMQIEDEKAVQAYAERNEAEIQQGRLENVRTRRANVREYLATMSAVIAGAANKGATGGSGFQAGRNDTRAQADRANRDAYQNLGILDQMDAANKVYAAALSEGNRLKAEQQTAENRWEFDKARMDIALQEKTYAATVSGLKKDTALTKSLYRLEDRSATIQSNMNKAVAGAKDQQAEGQTISNIGSSVASFGLTLFGD